MIDSLPASMLRKGNMQMQSFKHHQCERVTLQLELSNQLVELDCVEKISRNGHEIVQLVLFRVN